MRCTKERNFFQLYRGKPIKLIESRDSTAEVCEGIIELDERQQNKLEEVVKNKIPELGTELKHTH